MGESSEISSPSVLRSMGGYGASKRVAENLVRSAARQGLPAIVFRPGTIGGHSVTGVCSDSATVDRVLCGVVQMGAAPVHAAGPAPDVLAIAPVDYVVDSIIALARALRARVCAVESSLAMMSSIGANCTHEERQRILHEHEELEARVAAITCQDTPCPTVHLLSAAHVPRLKGGWAAVVHVMRECGYSVEGVGSTEWRQRLELLRDAALQEGSNSMLLPLAARFERGLPCFDDSKYFSESFCSSMLAAIGRPDIVCPAVTPAVIASYLRCFAKRALIPAAESS